MRERQLETREGERELERGSHRERELERERDIERERVGDTQRRKQRGEAEREREREFGDTVRRRQRGEAERPRQTDTETQRERHREKERGKEIEIKSGKSQAIPFGRAGIGGRDREEDSVFDQLVGLTVDWLTTGRGHNSVDGAPPPSARRALNSEVWRATVREREREREGEAFRRAYAKRRHRNHVREPPVVNSLVFAQ